MSRTCSRCGQTKGLDAFYVCAGKRRSYCKTCDNQRRWDLEKQTNGPRQPRPPALTAEERLRSTRATSAAWYARKKQEDPEYLRARGRRLRRERRARLAAAEVFRVTDHDLQRLLHHYQDRCAYCSSPWEQWDHVIPLSRGGRHSVGNLVPVCMACNYSKNKKLTAEWRFAS